MTEPSATGWQSLQQPDDEGGAGPMTGPWFVGLDLAWSDRHASGIAVLRWTDDGPRFVSAAVITSLEEIADHVRSLPGTLYLAIDAPLVVKNETGRRASDAKISAAYHRFHAGAHPTNLRLLKCRVRGGDLVAMLSADGVRVIEARPIPPRRPGRWAFETYPHPAMVELFGLDRIFKYKRGHVAQRRKGQQALAAAFRTELPRPDPALPVDGPLAALLTRDLDPLRGKALKGNEDTLDALLCAYLALHVWYWGERRIGRFGDQEAGEVILPALRSDVP